MSKSRMTFRFEHHTRQAAAGQARPFADTTDDTQVTAALSAKEGGESEAVLPSAPKEREASNVIPLRHYEFEVSEEPVLIEEREQTKSKSAIRRIDSSYPYDYGAWDHTASAEADELERIIREADQPQEEPARGSGRRSGTERPWEPELIRGGQSARSERSYPKLEDEMNDPETGYWPGGLDDQDYAAGGRASLRGRPADGPAWWKVAASVVGAIATGVLFGSFFLNFFTGDPPQGGSALLPGVTETASPTTGSPVNSEGGEGTSQAPPVVTGTSGGDGGAIAGDPSVTEPAIATVNLPERRMFLLQNGKFETLESARALANEMKNKGLAATIEESDGFYVYAGVMAERDDALRAGVMLQSKGIEVYVKPYQLPSVQQVRWEDGSADSLAAYIGKGSGMVRMIGDLTLVHLDGESPVAPEKSTLEKLQSEHLAMMEHASAATGGLPAEAQPMVERMDNAIRSAIMAIEEYRSHPDHAYLWSAQSALMDYLIAEKQLLLTVAMK